MDISQNDINLYQKEFEKSTKYKVLQGVLNRAPLVAVSANPNAINKLPFKFNHTLSEDVKATDQEQSGRCWIFAGLNIIRRKLITHYKLSPDFELSQAYIFRWDKFEKCNAGIELIYQLAKEGKNNSSIEYVSLIPGDSGAVTDGGTWGMFANIVKKYGVVPKDVYPDSAQVANSARMNQMLQITVLKTSDKIHKNMPLSEFRAYKKTVLQECYRIINLCMGNNPDKFEWAFKESKTIHKYTPKAFYDKIVKPLVDINKYVSICNLPTEDYNQTLCVEYCMNVLDQGDDIKKILSNSYLNIDIDIFKEAVFRSIKKDLGVWFACDVGQFWINRGETLDQNASNLKDMFDVDFTLSKRAALETRTSSPSHAMLIVGCQKEESEYQRWKVENSHGDDTGLKGFITMSDAWFNEYVISAAVPIDCLPVKLRKVGKVKWLPFYSVLGGVAD